MRKKLDERAKRPKRNADEDAGKEKRDLLDILLDCQNEDGARLNKEELVNQTKTYVEDFGILRALHLGLLGLFFFVAMICPIIFL